MSLGNAVIAIDTYEDVKGPVNTINAFQLALNGELFSFSTPQDLRNRSLAIPGTTPVQTSNIPVLSHFRYSPPQALAKARNSIANSAVVSSHGFYRYHSLWVNKVCREFKTPYWFVSEGILDPWTMSRKGYLKKLYWKLGGQKFVNEASAVIFATKNERDKALAQFDLPPCEVVNWVQDPIDNSNWQARRRAIRCQLNIPEEHRVLISLGRYHSMKRPLLTIEALAESGLKNVHLVMVGWEQDVTRSECRRLAERLGLSERVHALGPVFGEGRFDYLFAGDAYISLSHRENFNYAAAESLAAGLPVILSPGNDLLGEIAEAECYFALSDTTLSAAVEGILEFSRADLDQVQEMGRTGRAWVQQNLGMERFSAQILALAQKYGKA